MPLFRHRQGRADEMAAADGCGLRRNSPSTIPLSRLVLSLTAIRSRRSNKPTKPETDTAHPNRKPPLTIRALDRGYRFSVNGWDIGKVSPATHYERWIRLAAAQSSIAAVCTTLD